MVNVLGRIHNKGWSKEYKENYDKIFGEKKKINNDGHQKILLGKKKGDPKKKYKNGHSNVNWSK